MTTQATASLNTQLLRSPSGAGTYTKIAEIIDFTGPSASREKIDVSNFDSPSDYREYIYGFTDPGTISFNANFLPANATQNILKDDMDNNTLADYKIIWSDAAATEWTFSARVESFNPSANTGEQLKVAVTLGITGAITS